MKDTVPNRHGWTHTIPDEVLNVNASWTSPVPIVNYTYLSDTNHTSSSPTNITVPIRTPHAFELYAISFLILFCAVSLVVNLVIICSIRFMRTRIHPTLYMILSLAGADAFSLLFFGLGFFLFSFLHRVGVHLYAPCTLLFIETIRMGAIFTTLFHLAALACNHYLGIRKPLRYPIYMTRRNVQYCVVLLWTLPSLLLSGYVFYLEGDGFNQCPHVFLIKSKFRLTIAVPFFITLSLMIFIYSHIYILVCKNQTQPLVWRANRSSARHIRGRCSSFSENQVTKKAIVTTLMILGSTVVGWVPAFTYFALFCEDCLFRRYWRLQTPLEAVFLYTINFLLIAKTATNCYIYAFRVKEIKKALRTMNRQLLPTCCFYTAAGDSIASDGVFTRTLTRQATTTEGVLTRRPSRKFSARRSRLSHKSETNGSVRQGQRFRQSNTSV